MQSEWRIVQIKDVGRVVTGRTPPRSEADYFGSKIPFLTPTDMDGRRKIDQTSRHLSSEGMDILKSVVVPEGVAVSCIGWQMGKAVILDRQFATNQQINTIVPNRQIVDPLFLYYTLSIRRDDIFRLGAGGSRTPILNKSGFERFQIPLPSLPEQRMIAQILGSFDDKIELNRKMNATLEGMARAIFQSWFVDFDPVRAKAEGRAPAGMDEATAALFPDSFEEIDGRMVPHGWKTAHLGLIAENVRRGVDPATLAPETPYIGLEHMPRNSIALSDWGYSEGLESNKFLFWSGEILFGKLRPYFHKVGIAPVEGICSTDILVLRAKQDDWFALALGHISSSEFVQYANARSDGTKMPRTNWNDMAAYQITVPSIHIAKLYNERIRSLTDAIPANIHQSRTLAAIRDALLPKLLSGELRVREAEQIAEGVL